MKTRTISAIVALLICVPIIYIGGPLFYALGIILSLLGLREISNLIIDDKFTKIINYLMFIIVLSGNILNNNFDNLINFDYIGIILLIFGLITIFNYEKNIDVSKMFILLGIDLFLIISFSSIIITRNIGLNYFIYLLLLPLVNDAFAYIFGRLFGKHKITKISPKKTFEGCISGTLFSVIIGTIYYVLFINNTSVSTIIMINFLFSILGQFGDLFFSLIKRNYKIKDFSNLMPGHGGVLDRLDSVIFVFLAFIYFIRII